MSIGSQLSTSEKRTRGKYAKGTKKDRHKNPGVDGPESHGHYVRKYSGYSEDAYRLVWIYDTKFSNKAPLLQTINTAGQLLSEKALEPVSGGALVTYGYAQTIKASDAEKYAASPLVEKQPDESYRLLQVWTMRSEEGFTEFTQLINTSQGDMFFAPEVVEHFQKLVLTLFGKEAAESPILYGRRIFVSDEHVYVGTTENLMHFISSNSQIQLAFGVVKMLHDGFVVRWKLQTGQPMDYEFRLASKEKYVLYNNKQGFAHGMRATTLRQFKREFALHEPFEDLQK